MPCHDVALPAVRHLDRRGLLVHGSAADPHAALSALLRKGARGDGDGDGDRSSGAGRTPRNEAQGGDPLCPKAFLAEIGGAVARG